MNSSLHSCFALNWLLVHDSSKTELIKIHFYGHKMPHDSKGMKGKKHLVRARYVQDVLQTGLPKFPGGDKAARLGGHGIGFSCPTAGFIK